MMCQQAGIILCPKCREVKKGTRHHILPQRFYGNPPNAPILFLCRSCHDSLEEIIPQFQQLTDDEYFEIATDFLSTPAPARQYGKVLQFPDRRGIRDEM
jgi:hypothetical protein